METLKNKIAVITGGNSGIGFATAKEFKARGAQVIITGRSKEKVDSAAQELGVKGLVADVSDISQIQALAKEIKENFGLIDILFVNAGVFSIAPIGSINESHFDYQMNINFKGAVFTMEAFIPIFKDGGSIISLSSIAAATGTPNIAIYSATKAALNTYTKTVAIELAPRKIRANIVNPGPTETSIFEKLGFPQENLDFMKSSNENNIPLKRMGKPEEIAKLVAFLASDDASFITGAEINIDGGLVIKS